LLATRNSPEPWAHYAHSQAAARASLFPNGSTYS
jgi:hypothetical protein